jgi:hypothetical protein
MNVQTRFTAYEAKEARAESPVPLLIGLTGPSGSGKTFSALRIATGIREIVGGEIFVVDTEQRRALHYADRFDFQHVNFEAPFGALDYLEALRFCKTQGAGVVVIDSCSHEHDGPGGLLEQHEAYLDKIDPSGNDWKKRAQQAIPGWAKVKGGRRKLIASITTELNMPVIFCFRAKKSIEVVRGGNPIDKGYTSIGAAEWLFELVLNALLLPGAAGVPTWRSDLKGENEAIKLPEQFRAIADRGGPMTEAIGRSLAKWAAGTSSSGKVENEPRRFQAEKPTPTPDLEDDESAMHGGEDTPTDDPFTGDGVNAGGED